VILAAYRRDVLGTFVLKQEIVQTKNNREIVEGSRRYREGSMG